MRLRGGSGESETGGPFVRKPIRRKISLLRSLPPRAHACRCLRDLRSRDQRIARIFPLGGFLIGPNGLNGLLTVNGIKPWSWSVGLPLVFAELSRVSPGRWTRRQPWHCKSSRSWVREDVWGLSFFVYISCAGLSSPGSAGYALGRPPRLYPPRTHPGSRMERNTYPTDVASWGVDVPRQIIVSEPSSRCGAGRSLMMAPFEYRVSILNVE